MTRNELFADPLFAKFFTNFHVGTNLVVAYNERKKTMHFLYTVGRDEPKSYVRSPGLSLSSILQRSKITSLFRLRRRDPPSLVPLEFNASSTSHRFPSSSRITRLWLFVNSEVLRYVSIIRGGGRFWKLPQLRHRLSSSRKAAVSSVSI